MRQILLSGAMARGADGTAPITTARRPYDKFRLHSWPNEVPTEQRSVNTAFNRARGRDGSSRRTGPRTILRRGLQHFNHTNFGSATTNTTTPVNTSAQFDKNGTQVNAQFGQYTAAQFQRRLQLALRLSF